MEVGGVFRGVVEWWLERGNCEEVRRRQRTKPRLQKKKNSLPSAGGEESRRNRRSETFLPLSRERREQQGKLPPSPSLRAVVVSLSSSQWRITTSSTSSARARSARSGVVFLFLSSSLLFLCRQVHSFCSPPVASKPLSASPSLSSRKSTAFVHSIRAQKAVAALEMAFEARRQASFPFSLSFAPMPRHRSSFFSTSSASLLLPSPSSLFFALSTGALPPPQLHPAPPRSTRPDENTRAPSSPSSASPRPASPRGTSRDCAPRSTSCGGCATPGSSRCSTRSRRGTTSAW